MESVTRWPKLARPLLSASKLDDARRYDIAQGDLVKLKAMALPFLLALTAVAYGRSDQSDLYAVKIRKVKDNVYVAYRPNPLRYFVEGNVTIIINEHDVVVVDAGGAPQAARNAIAEIKKLTRHPVRYLVNTHDHVDHTLGIQEYVKAFPGVEIISHPMTRASLDTGGRSYVADRIKDFETRKERSEELFKRLREEGKPVNDEIVAYWEQYANHDIYTRTAEYRKAVITLPTATFEGKLVLYRGPRTIELLFLGHGDTPGDVVVYLPQDKIVCTGDMVTEPIPYGFSVKPLEWCVTLGKLSELDFDTLVPGHGEVQRGKAYLQRVMSLLQSVQDQVKGAVAAGLDLEGTRKKVDLSKFMDEFAQDDPVRQYRFQGWFVKPNVGATFTEIKERSNQP
jgi:glyoxylase-like metal-dependent hydrolase (beta-lactamase superfamily II)